MKESGTLPPVVVVGLDCMTGLQTARIFASHGVAVHGLAQNLSHPCCRTRVCRSRRQVPELSGEKLVDSLLQLSKELGAPAVLIPCTDLSVLAISRHREKLTSGFHFALPSRDTVELLVNKVDFYRWAQDQGVPVPRTHLLFSRQDAESAVTSLQFPCILKPQVKTERWESQTGVKAFLVRDASRFLALYARCEGLVDSMVVQEWIEGEDRDLFTCNCYISRDGEPLVTLMTQKLRQWPPVAGTGCLSRECCNDSVLELTLQLFQRLNLYGLGYLEVKRDRRTGRYVIIEPNIGRPTGRSATAEASGLEFLWTAYSEMIGLPLPEARRQGDENVKWIHWRRDLQAVFYHWRRGHLGLRELCDSWRGKKAHALFSWSDPAPFLFDWMSLTEKIWARLRRVELGRRWSKPGRWSDRSTEAPPHA